MINQLFLYFEIATVAGLVIAGIADLVFFVFGGVGMTLSARFWALSKQWPVIPAMLGMLFGHLVWQYNPDCPGVTMTAHFWAHHRLYMPLVSGALGFFATQGYHRARRQRDTLKRYG